jgi:hypothetical protein
MAAEDSTLLAPAESKTYTFAPNYRIVDTICGIYSIPALADEIGCYSATPEFIRAYCGPIANSLLDAVPSDYFDDAKRLGLFPNADIRIHRLYPGDYPAYPGWHCDGEFRETYFSQPDLDKIPVHRHLVGTVSTSSDGVSNTQFLAEPFTATLTRVPDQEITLWGMVHAQVEREQTRRTFDTRDGQMVEFDSWTLHRAMPAKVRGWRMFFRMSMWHKPNLGRGGNFTKQEQVYKLVEGGGW